MEKFDLIIIGSGPGGYVAAIRAAQLNMKVACVEKNSTLGGTCLNIGCIPSKTLLYASELYHKMGHQASDYGISSKDLSVDFNQMMNKKSQVVESFTKGIEALFKKNKISRFQGLGTFKTEKIIEVKTSSETIEITADHILLATGSEPISLPFLPFDEEKIISSTGALSLKKIPESMTIIGAGVIGLEIGSVYARLGTQVNIVELTDRVCPTFDLGVSKALLAIFQKQGLKFELSTKVTNGKIEKNHVELELFSNQGSQKISSEKVLVAIGRRPFTEGLGLEKVGVTKSEKGFIKIDQGFQTTIPSIFAIGDLIEGPMLAHKASEEAITAVEFIAGEKASINYMTIPNVMYTNPEVAFVGFTEEEAKEAGLEIKVGKFPFKANSRARCNGEEEGFIKVIAEATSKRIIGVHMIGSHVSEIIGEASLAIEKKMTARELAQVSQAHPTFSEALKEASLGVYQNMIHL